MRRWLDDAFVLAGAACCGIGLWCLSPTAVWFYAGAWLILIGFVIPRRTR